MKFLLIPSALWVVFFGGELAHAENCQILRVIAQARATPSGFLIVVAEGSKSEKQLKIPIKEEPKLVPYLELPITAWVRVTQPWDGTRVTVDSIEKIKLRVPDPLRESSKKLIQSSRCK